MGEALVTGKRQGNVQYLSKRRLALAAFIGIGILLVWFRPVFRQPMPETVRFHGIWLYHSWVRENHQEQDYAKLAEGLEELEITDAYYRSGPLLGDGSVPSERFAYAPKLLSNMKKFAPDIRCHAWLGQIQAKAGGPLDLSSEATRRNIVSSAEAFLDMGFDAIHYDIEPIRSGDQDFLQLVRDTLEVTNKRGKMLSIASSMPEPVPGMEETLKQYPKLPGYWTKTYFREVASMVDQVAIMAYDTASRTPEAYQEIIASITEWVALEGFDNVLIGLPTYEEVTQVHDPKVENLANGLMGLKVGLGRLEKPHGGTVGVALFADWTTSAEERQLFIDEWVRVGR